MTPWGPALPPPHPLRWSGRGRRRYWTPGPDVGSTATSNFDKHCARNGSEEQGSHSQDRAKQTNLGSSHLRVLAAIHQRDHGH